MRIRWFALSFLLGVLPLWGQETPRPTVQELIAVLNRSDASVHDRARACQQLGEFGTKDAVAALTALLPDPVLSAYARSGLEGIPDPAAAAALRTALPGLKGNQLIGVVNSLGALRDAKSVPILAKLAADPRPGAAREALLALGRIANRESLDILRRALSAGPESLRSGAGAACLLAAEMQLRANEYQSAAELYDAVRAANTSTPVRLAATRGAILARRSAGTDLLASLLRSDDAEIRTIALHSIRDLSDPRLGSVLRAELGAAQPELQAQIIIALADCCRDPESLRTIRGRAGAGSPEVREAALKALGKVGDGSDANTLVQAVQGRSPAESSAAAYSLARLEGADVDAAILNGLKSATGSESRIALIDLIDDRPPSRAATGELLKLAGDADVKVGLAALRPLRSLAAPEDVPALIGITKACTDTAQKTAAERALSYAITRTALSSTAADLVLAELPQAREDADRGSWMRVLSTAGYARALPAISSNLRSSDSILSRAAAESLGNWPDPAPVKDLLDALQTISDSGTRMSVLSSVGRLTTAAIENRQAPLEDALGWLRQAGSAGRSAEERNVLIPTVFDALAAAEQELKRACPAPKTR